jgi:hypothetical protein
MPGERHVTVQNRLTNSPLPCWPLRLRPADYANNDLNPSIILTEGAHITGVVDCDGLRLGSRTLDLVALALDCEHAAEDDRLLDRATQAADRRQRRTATAI